MKMSEQVQFQAGDLVRLKKRTAQSPIIVLAINVSDGVEHQAVLSPGVVGIVTLDQLSFSSKSICRVLVEDKIYDISIDYLVHVEMVNEDV